MKNFFTTTASIYHTDIKLLFIYRNGFKYRSCDCLRPCIPGRNMTEVEFNCASCEPICTCRTGFYEHNGECISADQCLNLEPEEMMYFMCKLVF